MNKDLTDFLLAEYENIAKAYFSAHDITAKWFKYYLLMLASPFSIIVFIYHNNPNSFDLFNLSYTISILIFLIGILSILVSFIIINSRLDATLYARTVNGIRKYFVDLDNLKTSKNKIHDLNKYLVLPTQIDKPKFMKREGDLIILVLFMAVINSLYITLGFKYFLNINEASCKIITLIIITIVIFLIHIQYYRFLSKRKENTYAK